MVHARSLRFLDRLSDYPLKLTTLEMLALVYFRRAPF